MGDFELGGPISIAAWAKYEVFNNWSPIISFRNNQADDRIALMHFSSTNSANFEVYRNSSYRYLRPTNFWQANQWVHAVATVDAGGVMKLYRGGSLFDTKTDGWTPNVLTRTKQYIGRGASSDISFNGLMDDIRIYDRALTVAQAQALYQLGQ